MPTPTEETYSEWQHAYDFFNAHLFAGQCVIATVLDYTATAPSLVWLFLRESLGEQDRDDPR